MPVSENDIVFWDRGLLGFGVKVTPKGHKVLLVMYRGMARLGVPPHIADKTLNHQSGTISGVAAGYQRHEFLEERKAALDLWARHFDQLVAAKQAPAISA